MEVKDQRVECPHCGNRALFKILHVEDGQDELEGPKEIGFYIFDFSDILGKCTSCDKVALFITTELDDDPTDLKQAFVLYPHKKDLSQVPTGIREIYEEARKIKNISPTLFVVGVRKALEVLCNEQNAEGSNLITKIQDLSKKGVVPGHLGRMANALRVFGNIGAHDETAKVSLSEAMLIDDLYSAIVEYVYIAPSKLNALTEQYKKKFASR